MKIYVGMKFRRENRFYKDLFIVTRIYGDVIEFKSLNRKFEDSWRNVKHNNKNTLFLDITHVIEFKDYLNKL